MPTDEHQAHRPRSWRRLGRPSSAITAALAAITAALIGVLGPPLLEDSAEQAPTARIESPRDGDTIGRRYIATGSLAHIPNDRQVWLVVQQNGLLSPKTPELDASQRDWEIEIVEDTTKGFSFTLKLIMVGVRGNQEIRQWLEAGRRRGEYPPLYTITESRVLDEVRKLSVPGRKSGPATLGDLAPIRTSRAPPRPR